MTATDRVESIVDAGVELPRAPLAHGRLAVADAVQGRASRSTTCGRPACTARRSCPTRRAARSPTPSCSSPGRSTTDEHGRRVTITDIWVDSPAVRGRRPRAVGDPQGPVRLHASSPSTAGRSRPPSGRARDRPHPDRRARRSSDVSRAAPRLPFKGGTWQPGIHDTGGEERTATLQGSSKALPVPGLAGTSTRTARSAGCAAPDSSRRSGRPRSGCRSADGRRACELGSGRRALEAIVRFPPDTVAAAIRPRMDVMHSVVPLKVQLRGPDLVLVVLGQPRRRLTNLAPMSSAWWLGPGRRCRPLTRVIAGSRSTCCAPVVVLERIVAVVTESTDWSTGSQLRHRDLPELCASTKRATRIPLRARQVRRPPGRRPQLVRRGVRGGRVDRSALGSSADVRARDGDHRPATSRRPRHHRRSTSRRRPDLPRQRRRAAGPASTRAGRSTSRRGRRPSLIMEFATTPTGSRSPSWSPRLTAVLRRRSSVRLLDAAS